MYDGGRSVTLTIEMEEVKVCNLKRGFMTFLWKWRLILQEELSGYWFISVNPSEG